MAREIIVLCDKHLERDERVASTPMVLEADGLRRSVDLCAECVEQYVTPVADLLREHGQSAVGASSNRQLPLPVSLRQKTPKEAKCLICESQTIKSGWGKHMREQHGMDPMGMVNQLPCPVCGIRVGRMAMHFAQTHEDIGPHMSHGFLWAMKNGDPHGSAARLMAYLDSKSR